MRKAFFFGSTIVFGLLATIDGRGEGLYRGSNGRMTFISGVELADSQLELERKKNLRIIEILQEICKKAGVKESPFLEEITDPLELCELLRTFFIEKGTQEAEKITPVHETLSNNDPLAAEQTIISSEGGDERIVLSESMIKDVLQALQRCTESFQRKEEEEHLLEKKDLELRERELAFQQEWLSWERERTEKKLAWKKKQYIRDLMKQEQK